MKRIFSILIFLILIVSCKKEKFDVANLNGNEIDVMGHAGMGISSSYPINSFGSILNCLNLGATGTEFDVQLTKDNVLVAFHDDDLTNSTNGQGLINSMTWEEVKNATYDVTPYTSYSIISLEELFSQLTNHKDFKFSLDIKLYPAIENQNEYHEKFTDALIALYDKYDLANHAYIESQNKDFLAMLHAKKSNYSLYHYSSSFQESFTAAKELGIKGIVISNKYITADEIAIAHSEGIFVTLWDVRSKSENREAARKNPDMIETDKVDYLIKLLEQ